MSMKIYTDIPADVRREVLARDSLQGKPCCIYCGNPNNLEISHYVPRSRGGMGIKTNLVVHCSKCHRLFHQNDEYVKAYTKYYLGAMYPGWSEELQIYKKDQNGETT